MKSALPVTIYFFLAEAIPAACDYYEHAERISQFSRVYLTIFGSLIILGLIESIHDWVIKKQYERRK